MNFLKVFLGFLATVVILSAEVPSKYVIIEKARAAVGSEDDLDALITLKMTGELEPADKRIPQAKLLIVARKPCSQRMEIRVDDLVETTILNGKDGCIIRTNLEADQSQMRKLIGEELAHVSHNTRQFFNFYHPDYKGGEIAAFEGVVRWRGVECYKLVYTYMDGLNTTRYFSTEDFSLVATVTDKGVESVGRGEIVAGGVKFPQRIEYYEDGKKLHAITINEVIANGPLTEGIFDIPVGQKRRSK